MKESKELVYNFIEHGLYYEKPLDYGIEETISLVVDTLEIEINYSTGSILSTTGFLPLLKASKKNIPMPLVTEGEVCVSTKDIEYQNGIAYDYFKFFPESEKYLVNEGLPILEYDDTNKRILVGSRDDSNGKYVKVNKNLICGFDNSDNLKSLLIMVDVVIK